jgi:peptidylprolyl isomerase
MENGLFAKFNTNKGEILVKLHYKKTPGTVGNFVALVEGKQPNNAKNEGTAYYNGLKFHRVIPNFMIQGGDPDGTGAGGPGYQFNDEIHPDLKHDQAGILSMANAGPGTNGSQFFITHEATPWLDGKHTIFGKVVNGQDIVNVIAQGDEMKEVSIVRVGEEAKNFDALKAFNNFNAEKNLQKEKAKQKETEAISKLTKGFDKTNSGLFYKITDNGTGTKAKKGKNVKVHYRGKLTDGSVFDSSFERNQPIEFPVGVGHVIAGWDEGILLLSEGDKATFVIPSQLAYGKRGAGGVIPPNATLVFDVELLKVN